ncbi:MAG TPA: histidine kinase [Gammaproteobacteria bacterium]
MHPVFSSNRGLQAIIVLWLALSFLLAFMVSEYSESGLADGLLLFTPWYFILLFFCLSNFYLCELLPLDNTRMARLLGAQGAAATVTALIWMTLGYFWAKYGPHSNAADPSAVFQSSMYINAALGGIVYIVWIIVHYAWLNARGNEEDNSEKLRQKLLISQIELQVIRATLHPHFLYNSLNMLANLSLAAPEKIHSLCVQMSDFLRYSVNYAKKDVVTVNEELAHIQNYLNIEQERFGDKLKLEYTVDNAARPEMIIPLILFPLVENSIKHGIDSSLDGGFINVEILKRSNELIFDISNSFDPTGIKPQSSGLGQQSLQKRIAAHYGVAARMNIHKENGLYRVTLSLPAVAVRSLEAP